jgi:tetratricopeptide (TPR) repeat protein
MLMETQPAFKASSILKGLGSDPVLTDVIPSSSQLFESFEPLQIRVPTPTVSKTYPESAYQWLVEVLDGVIDVGNRHGHYGVINLMENEYQWLDEVLEELIYSVGDNENHILAPLMEFVIRLISNYEDAYVPKLTEQFAKLAEGKTIETENKKRHLDENSTELNGDELVAHAFFSIGYLLYQGNQSEKALSAYDKAIALKPDFLEAYHNRGTVLLRLGKHDKALIDFDKAIEVGLNSVETYYYRAIAKNELDQHDFAIQDYDKVIALKPDFMEAYNLRGLSKDKIGQHDEAIVDYTEAIRQKPDYAEAYNNRGISHSMLRQHDKALADYTEAIRLKPDYATAYYNRAFEKMRQGDLDSAILDYTEAIRLKSDYAEAYTYRGVVKVHLAHIGDPKSDFQTALELAEKQGQGDLKTFIEKQLHELNNSTTQDCEN